MKKNTKELLFERMHTIGGMPLNEGVYERNGVTIDTSPSDKTGSFKERIHYKIGDAILDLGKHRDNFTIIELNVPEEYRRRGIAKKLMKTALDDMQGIGFSGQASNEIAIKLNYDLGFRAFDENGNELSLEGTKEKRRQRGSVNMLSPDLIKRKNLR